MKIGTALLSIMTFVWSEVPEAILVKAQAASNFSKKKKRLNITFL